MAEVKDNILTTKHLRKALEELNKPVKLKPYPIPSQLWDKIKSESGATDAQMKKLFVRVRYIGYQEVYGGK